MVSWAKEADQWLRGLGLMVWAIDWDWAWVACPQAQGEIPVDS